MRKIHVRTVYGFPYCGAVERSDGWRGPLPTVNSFDDATCLRCIARFPRDMQRKRKAALDALKTHR